MCPMLQPQHLDICLGHQIYSLTKWIRISLSLLISYRVLYLSLPFKKTSLSAGMFSPFEIRQYSDMCKLFLKVQYKNYAVGGQDGGSASLHLNMIVQVLQLCF